jgi:polar amino acid transport system permease protein
MTSAEPLFDWRFAWAILPRLLDALTVTIEAVAFGTIIALLLGAGWAIARRSPRAFVRVPAYWAVELVRGTPLLIQLYILYFVLPSAGLTLSPLATGTVGLGLHYSAYVAEVFRAGIEAVPRGQWDASLALGFSRAHTWRAVILPQALARSVPALGNYVIAMFKDTPLLAAITVSELLKTAKLIGATHFRYLEPLTMVGALFLVVSLVAARLVRLVEQRHAVRHA